MRVPGACRASARVCAARVEHHAAADDLPGPRHWDGLHSVGGEDGGGAGRAVVDRNRDVPVAGRLQSVVCSTGLNGERLPIHKLLPAVNAAADRSGACGSGAPRRGWWAGGTWPGGAVRSFTAARPCDIELPAVPPGESDAHPLASAVKRTDQDGSGSLAPWLARLHHRR